MKKYACALALLSSSVAFAAAGPQTALLNFPAQIENDCLTDAVALRTHTQRLDSTVTSGWVRIAQTVQVTVDDATDLEVTITCTRSNDGSIYGAPPSLSVSSGVATVTPLVLKRTFVKSATSAQTFDLDVFGYRYLKCVYAPVGTADAGDRLWVYWTAAASK